MKGLWARLGIALTLVVLAFENWDRLDAPNRLWPNAAILGLLWAYGMLALFSLGGRNAWRDAAFGMALFGGSHLLIGSSHSSQQIPSHALVRWLHPPIFNAIAGTKYSQDDATGMNSGRRGDPFGYVVRWTMHLALRLTSLPFGPLRRNTMHMAWAKSPLPRADARARLFASIFAVAGMAVAFYVPNGWSVNIATGAVAALMLYATLVARYGRMELRDRAFGFALFGGLTFVLGSFGAIWLSNPVGELIIAALKRYAPEAMSPGRHWNRGGYLSSHIPSYTRLHLGLLFATVPAGLFGAYLYFTRP